MDHRPVTDWRDLVALEFEAISFSAYLDAAATSPLPARTRQAVVAFLDDRSRRAEAAYDEWLAAVDRARETVGRLIGASGAEIAFVKNTGDAINTVAYAIDWKPGNSVVTCDIEFPTNRAPWQILARKFGVEVRRVCASEGRFRVEDVERLIDDTTRLVSLSWVQYGSGFRIDPRPVAGLCRERGALFLLDAIQGLGALPLDAPGCGADFVACGGHKWLCAPLGVGILYCRRKLIEATQPPFAGWMNWADLSRFEDCTQPFAPTARRFEPGNLAMSNIFGLEASVELLLEVGLDEIAPHVLALSGRIIEECARRGYRVVTPAAEDERSGIVSLEPRTEVSRLLERLAARGVRVAGRAGRLRASPHFYNTVEQVERFLEALFAEDR